jgi:hypothetical protein
MPKYWAKPCNCGYDRCPDWHVAPVADAQGVSFTKEQAEAVAELLNEKEAD